MDSSAIRSSHGAVHICVKRIVAERHVITREKIDNARVLMPNTIGPPISGDKLDFAALRRACLRPEPFAPGEPLFWDDDHISQQMLAVHLDPENDLASRKPDTIERTVQWLLDYLRLQPGDRILDLGCGPGVYCERFSRAGLAVSGIDFSRRSIEFARAQAARDGRAIEYVYSQRHGQ
jgi:2-polyprenyl-3-methyl-5-hydroxy-6-metoxy-1,4-benzoquinol methylase